MSITPMDAVSLISFLIAVGSICVNVIQHYRRKSLMKEFEAYVRSSYDTDFMVARCASRMRKRQDEKYTAERLLHYFWCEIQSITGLVDAARSNAAAVAQTHLGFTPAFRHPAYPGETPDEATLLGLPPEKQRLAMGKKVDRYATGVRAQQ